MGVESHDPAPGMEEMAKQLQGLFQNLGSQPEEEAQEKVKEAMRR